MKSSTKILIGIGAGLVLGGILGVLFAPGKGMETRKKFNGAGKKLAELYERKFRKGKFSMQPREDFVTESELV